jgi:phenylacetate-CoA ligase
VKLLPAKEGEEKDVLAHLKDQLRLETNLRYNFEVHLYGSPPRYELKAKRVRDFPAKITCHGDR